MNCGWSKLPLELLNKEKEDIDIPLYAGRLTQNEMLNDSHYTNNDSEKMSQSTTYDLSEKNRSYNLKSYIKINYRSIRQIPIDKQKGIQEEISTSMNKRELDT